MFSVNRTYLKTYLFPLGLFLLSGITAIVFHQPYLLIVPFAWVLVPVIAGYCIHRSENIFWLLLITLPLSTEWNLTPSLGWDFPDEMLLIVLTGMLLVKWIHQPQWFPRALLKDPLFAVTILYFIWIAITCVYAAEPLLAVKYLLAKTWYILPLVGLPQLLFKDRQAIGRAGILLVVPMCLVVISTLIRHAFYGFSFADTFHTMAPFFRNHVNYSSMLVCLLPVAWCIRQLTPNHHPAQKWLNYGLVIGLAGLVFAYSRGAWVALLAGIAGYFIIRKKLMRIFVLLAFFAVVISVVWLVTDQHYMQFAPDHDHTVFHTDFGEHMQATVALKDVSTAERLYRWVAGARMLADKPLTGFGPNAFYLHYRPYTVSSFETWVSDNPEHSTVHNYFLLTALEQGLPGLALFCVLYFGMLLRVQQLYQLFQSRFYRMVTITIGIILIMIGVINTMSDMIETDKVGSLFWLCMGMLLVLQTRLGEEKRELSTVSVENNWV